MRLQDFIIALIVFSVVIVAFALVGAGVTQQYELNDTGFSMTSVNKYDQIKNLSDDVSNTFENSDDLSSVEAIGSYAKGSFGTLLLFLAAPEIVQSSLAGFITYSGLPINPIFGFALTSILFIMIVFAVIFAMVRVQP